jgi:tryptophan synthase alpha chain
MSRIDRTFCRLREARRTGLVTYVTAGDPTLPRTAEILVALDRAGADVLEVGVPFSDPVADGPVIQQAAERALAGGTTLARVLELVGDVRAQIEAPIVLFSYLNPLLRMGLPELTRRAAAAGVDGVLVVDVPLEEAGEIQAANGQAGLDTILLVSPTTTSERLRKAAASGRGFLYGICRLGVTGTRSSLPATASELARRVRGETSLPLALGFGISSPQQVKEAGRLADAAVVGSGLVSVIGAAGDAPALIPSVTAYVGWLRGEVADRGAAGVAKQA